MLGAAVSLWSGARRSGGPWLVSIRGAGGLGTDVVVGGGGAARRSSRKASGLVPAAGLARRKWAARARQSQ